MKSFGQILFTGVVALSCAAIALAQPPAGGRGGSGAGRGAPRLTFWVTSTSFPDGGEIPMTYSGRGDNKSPAFEFHWDLGTNPTTMPDTVKTYAVVLHDIQNVGARNSTSDTLHWTAFNIPASAKGIPEGIANGDLPDGTRNGPGVRPGQFFGPGAPAGPAHHYVFEFYALDTKLDLPATTTRDELMKAMDGHVVGKAAYFGRFPSPQ